MSAPRSQQMAFAVYHSFACVQGILEQGTAPTHHQGNHIPHHSRVSPCSYARDYMGDI